MGNHIKEHLLVNDPPKPKLHTLPEQYTKHLIELTIHILKPTHKKIMHSLTHECHSPNRPYSIFQQARLLPYFGQCRKPQRQSPRCHDSPKIAPQLLVHHSPMYMLGHIKTKHPMHTKCPQSQPNPSHPLITIHYHPTHKNHLIP